ncbi:MAG TPA: hypothetical protein VM260_23480 [Pirellula sp.]|nr:hypothetical protein [Pirellula sp.]
MRTTGTQQAAIDTHELTGAQEETEHDGISEQTELQDDEAPPPFDAHRPNRPAWAVEETKAPAAIVININT